MGIPENIDALLVKFDITQDHLARIAQVTPSAVTGWRKGSVPRRTAIKNICDYFRLTEDDILSEVAGLAAKEHGAAMSNRLPVTGMPMGKVPLVGHTHAGEPILPEEVDEYPEVSIPQFLIDRDPDSYGLAVDGDCMDAICPPGMVAVVQPNVAVRSGDVVVATIDGSDSIMRRATVINGDLILSPESHDKSHENVYVAANDERSVRLQHVSWFQSQDAF